MINLPVYVSLHGKQPSITPILHPLSRQLGFCLFGFDTKEAIDCYSTNDLRMFRDAIDVVLSENPESDDVSDQMVFWNKKNFDSSDLDISSD